MCGKFKIFTVLAIVGLFSSLCYSMDGGTVIVFKDGRFSRPIARHTGSGMNHVAIYLDGYVYEATHPVVRRMTLKKYKAFMNGRQNKVRALSFLYLIPAKPFSTDELTKMKTFAISELGRDYKMSGWWKDKEMVGTHCSQYVGEILASSGRIKLSRPWKQSPFSIYNQPLWQHNRRRVRVFNRLRN